MTHEFKIVVDSDTEQEARFLYQAIFKVCDKFEKRHIINDSALSHDLEGGERIPGVDIPLEEEKK